MLYEVKWKVSTDAHSSRLHQLRQILQCSGAASSLTLEMSTQGLMVGTLLTMFRVTKKPHGSPRRVSKIETSWTRTGCVLVFRREPWRVHGGRDWDVLQACAVRDTGHGQCVTSAVRPHHFLWTCWPEAPNSSGLQIQIRQRLTAQVELELAHQASTCPSYDTDKDIQTVHLLVA